MFYFVVRHFRWLARFPGLPPLFDALLLAWTCLAHRSRLAAMETLEKEAMRLPDMRLRTHRFGGMEFLRDGRELGHLHGCGLLDAHVGRTAALALIAAGQAHPHHVLPHAGWISFQLETPADAPHALRLLMLRQTSGIPPLAGPRDSTLNALSS